MNNETNQEQIIRTTHITVGFNHFDGDHARVKSVFFSFSQLSALPLPRVGETMTFRHGETILADGKVERITWVIEKAQSSCEIVVIVRGKIYEKAKLLELYPFRGDPRLFSEQQSPYTYNAVCEWANLFVQDVMIMDAFSPKGFNPHAFFAGLHVFAHNEPGTEKFNATEADRALKNYQTLLRGFHKDGKLFEFDEWRIAILSGKIDINEFLEVPDVGPKTVEIIYSVLQDTKDYFAKRKQAADRKKKNN